MITDILQGGDALTVDKLENNVILITLCEKDMKEFALDFNAMSLNDAHSHKIIMRIIQLACLKSGIEMKNKSIMLEALPLDGGCCILMTLAQKSRRTYKLKNKNESVCYALGDISNFLDTLEKLYRQNVCCNRNSAYVYNQNYYLIFDYPSVPKKLKGVLCEYGKKCGGKVACARIKENGREICKINAIACIGSAL